MAETQSESTTSLYVPTVDTVIAQAYRRAGLLNEQQSPSTIQLSLGRPLLMDLIHKLNAEGIFMRQVRYEYVPLVLAQNQYILPEYVIDIVGNGSYIDPTQSQVPFQASAETPVIMKTREFWQQLTAKSAQSRPSIGYFSRNAPQSILFIWPNPSASEVGGQIRFQFQVERADLTLGTQTLPFERYWTAYFVWALAAVLAYDNSQPQLAASLGAIAAADLAACKGFSKQNVSQQVSINHPTAWSRRCR